MKVQEIASLRSQGRARQWMLAISFEAHATPGQSGMTGVTDCVIAARLMRRKLDV